MPRRQAIFFKQYWPDSLRIYAVLGGYELKARHNHSMHKGTGVPNSNWSNSCYPESLPWIRYRTSWRHLIMYFVNQILFVALLLKMLSIINWWCCVSCVCYVLFKMSYLYCVRAIDKEKLQLSRTHRNIVICVYIGNSVFLKLSEIAYSEQIYKYAISYFVIRHLHTFKLTDTCLAWVISHHPCTLYAFVGFLLWPFCQKFIILLLSKVNTISNI